MRPIVGYLRIAICCGPFAQVALGDTIGKSAGADSPDPLALAELRRVEIVERVSSSAVCMLDHAKRGGGSGVLISPDGYGLTNYHVVAGQLDTRKGWGGLGDGVLYELDVLGIDPTGDVAMFRLKGSGRLPFSPLGDSDAMRLGAPVFSVGNPFVMSEDYSPSVALGIVTGVHRYQWGVGGNLTYSDCIQTDAAINPGNSGGPLFNMAGEIVGINGRISVNTRGRYNVGFGYAISSNQIRRFIPALRAGLIARHGTLLATVESDGDLLRFQRIAPDSPLAAAGIHSSDRLISFDGVRLRSANHYVSLLGAYPEDWPVPLAIESAGEEQTRIVRLASIDPNMKTEFTVDREVNLTEVRRILDAFRNATLPDGTSGATKRRSWTITRERLGQQGGEERQTFLGKYASGEPIELVRRQEEGRLGPTITYDSESATRRENESGEPARLPADVEMVYLALYVMQDRMLRQGDALNLDGVSAGGADFPTGRADIGANIATPPWEVIDWPIAGHVVARYSFDPDSGRCMRIRVKDVPSGAEVSLELMDHKDVGGGLTWPGTIEVNGPGLGFRDTLSNWEHPS